MARRFNNTENIFSGFGLIFLFSLPAVLPQYWLHVAIVSLFYVLMASSWNLVAGFTGQVSFAHAAFAAVGAYVSGMLTIHTGISPFVSVVVATLVASLLGLGLGCLCLPLGGIYLSLSTLGFSEILRIVITNEDRWTRGTMGLQVPGLFEQYSKAHYYFLFLAVTVIVVWGLRWITCSDLGLQFRAVMNDELAAMNSGVPTTKVRVIAFAISSAIAGLAGGIYGHYLMLITPDISSLGQMFLILAMAVIGGLGTIWGPILGAVFLEVLSEYIRGYGEYHILIFGLIALVIVRFAPQGVVGIVRKAKVQT